MSALREVAERPRSFDAKLARWRSLVDVLASKGALSNEEADRFFVALETGAFPLADLEEFERTCERLHNEGGLSEESVLDMFVGLS